MFYLLKNNFFKFLAFFLLLMTISCIWLITTQKFYEVSAKIKVNNLTIDGSIVRSSGLSLNPSNLFNFGVEVGNNDLFFEYLKSYDFFLSFIQDEKIFEYIKTHVSYFSSKDINLLSTKDIYEILFNKVVLVSENASTGLVEITILSYKPNDGAEMLQGMIDTTENNIKSILLKSSENLLSSIENSNISLRPEINFRNGIVEDNLKIIFLLNNDEDYILEIITKPYFSEDPSYPNLFLRFIFIFIFSLLLSFFIVFRQYALKLSKKIFDA